MIIYADCLKEVKTTARLQMEVLRNYVTKADLEENFDPIFSKIQGSSDFQEAVEHFKKFSEEIAEHGLSKLVNRGFIDLAKVYIKEHPC